MRRSINRAEWIVGGVLAVILVVALGLLLFYWSQGRESAATTEATLTAQTAWAKAAPVARNWASDAQLVNARTTWNWTSTGEYEPLDWSLIAYSPSLQATALFAVNETDVNLLRSRPVRDPLTPAPLALWQVDSPAVADEFFATINDIDPGFMETVGAATFVMTLILTETPPTWTASLSGTANEQYFWVKFNAESGAALDIEQLP